MIRNKKGFTLVELLAVIVILAIILVIAVPQIMTTIEESRKAAFISNAKLIAVSAEREYLIRKILGDTSFKQINVMDCNDIVETNNIDYKICNISFDDNGIATIVLVGSGKFEGKYICNGNKTNVEISDKKCDNLFEQHSWSTILANIQLGVYPYSVGDIKTIELGNNFGTHTLRISNTTPCTDSVVSKTACGFVIEFADIITNGIMNENATNVGGYKDSKMRTYLNSTIYNAIPKELRNIIISTKVVSGHGSTEGETNFVTEDDKLYLLSAMEVFGSNPGGYDTATAETRQLDYYKENGVTESNYIGAKKNNGSTASVWWLRTARSITSDRFYGVSTTGNWGSAEAHYSYGVSPAFKIA